MDYVEMKDSLGRADWIWDEELNCHIPCCSRWVIRDIGHLTGQVRKCGNGPLNTSEYALGTCSEGRHVDPERLTKSGI